MKHFLTFLFLCTTLLVQSQSYQIYFGNALKENVVSLDRVEENLPIAVEYQLDMVHLNRSFSYALDSVVAVIYEDAEVNEYNLHVINIDGFGTSYEIYETTNPYIPFVIRFEDQAFGALSLSTALDKIRNNIWYQFTNQK